MMDITWVTMKNIIFDDKLCAELPGKLSFVGWHCQALQATAQFLGTLYSGPPYQGVISLSPGAPTQLS